MSGDEGGVRPIHTDEAGTPDGSAGRPPSGSPRNLHLETARRLVAWGGVHEADFHLFAALDGLQGLFLDVGANVGHSALSLFQVNGTLRVLALEPNPELAPALEEVQALHPGRFEYRLVGAAEVPRCAVLVMPSAEGVDLSPRATLDPAELETEKARRELAVEAPSAGGRVGRHRVEVDLVRVDDLGVAPLVVKLDVEGAERAALEGMERTLQAWRPLLLVERNHPERFLPLLRSWGYRPFRYLAAEDRLEPAGEESEAARDDLNVFALHPAAPPALGGRLAARLPGGVWP